MTKRKILYIAQEISPYVEESVSDQSQLLPLDMLERGDDIRVFMPNYGTINERRHQLHEVIRLSGVNLTVNDRVHQLIVKVASLLPQRMQVYFIDNDDLFARKGTVRDQAGELYEDNVQRAVFFIRGVFETIKKLRWVPDVIHCQGWFSGLAPLYLKTLFKDDPALSGAKLVFSVYDMTPEVPFGKNLTEVLKYDGITHELLDGAPLTREELTKLIFHFIDGIVFGTQEISNDVVEWAKEFEDVNVLEYLPVEESLEAISNLYDELLKGNSKQEE